MKKKLINIDNLISRVIDKDNEIDSLRIKLQNSSNSRNDQLKIIENLNIKFLEKERELSGLGVLLFIIHTPILINVMWW